MNSDKLIHPDISEAIIGSAMKVLNTLKPGLDEKAYENALVIELRKRGHKVDQQKRFEVRYEGELVDILVPDMVVDDLVIAASQGGRSILSHPHRPNARLPDDNAAAPRTSRQFQVRRPALEAGHPLNPISSVESVVK
jgi:GxxExxY protein